MKHDSELIALAAANHHFVTSTEVKAAGLSPSQWERRRRSGLWLPIVPGVWRHAATPLTWEMKVRAGSRWLGREAGLYGMSALRWWGIDGCTTETVAFLTPRARRHLTPWLELHTSCDWPRGSVLTHRGVRTCDATRAIIDAARTHEASELAAAIDGAIRARRTSLPTLTARMTKLAGRNRIGIDLLRELLLDSGGESFLERRFLRLLRSHNIPRPTTQVVHRPRGARVIRVDFEFTRENLVVEVSGRVGHVSDADRTKDATRRNWLQSQGKRYLEFTTTHVISDPGYVVTTLRAELGLGVG